MPPLQQLSTIQMTSSYMEIDASTLDVSKELIDETPQKKPTLSPKSTSQDVIKRLGIVTGEGRVDATTSNSLNTVVYWG